MFTSTDIRDIAVQIERNGEKAYRAAGTQARDPEIAGIFTWMADEECRHAAWFEALESARPLTGEEREGAEMGRRLLQEMVAGQTFSLEAEQLREVRDFADMVQQAQSFERDTILFYEFLRDLIEDEAARRQLDIIISEERHHIEQLAELADTAAATCRNLAPTAED